MKRITKGLEPEEFSDWKAQDRMAHRPRWNRVPTAIKGAVKRSLMQEQGFICCYCESRLSINDCHVEHFRPIKGHSAHQLCYENLHCSCQGDTDPGEPRHCVHGKGRWYDENLLISPLDEGCEGRFGFTADGRIFPRLEDDTAAEATIRRLQLDLPKLRALRAAALDVLYEFSKEEIWTAIDEKARGGIPALLHNHRTGPGGVVSKESLPNLCSGR